MKIRKCNLVTKLDHWLGNYFNIMALIRTIGVILVALWSMTSCVTETLSPIQRAVVGNGSWDVVDYCQPWDNSEESRYQNRLDLEKAQQRWDEYRKGMLK